MLVPIVALHLLLTTSVAASPTIKVEGLGSLTGTFVSDGTHSREPSSVTAFLGIPYARPPIGDLRWRPPQPHGPWDSPRDATAFGHSCWQVAPSFLPINATLDEDCLFLNVFTPSKELSSGRRLPVMLWIHGGAYALGNSDPYVADQLISNSDFEVVVVTTNYRLNVFGFLGSEDLRGRSTGGSIGNYGIQDQRLAMKWVKQYISAFGGDGNDVTIFGESAGGNSVINHLVQRDSFPYYSKAIIESGTYNATTLMEQAEIAYTTIKTLADCRDVDCLVKLDAKLLVQFGTPDPEHPTTWTPVTDGVELMGTTIDLVDRGAFNNKVPIMIGSNRDEMAMFLKFNTTMYPADMTVAQLDEALELQLGGKSDVPHVKALYDAKRYPFPKNLGHYNLQWWTAMRVQTDMVPGLGPCGVRHYSRSFVEGSSPAVFAYLFANTPAGEETVAHSAEISYVFGNVSSQGEEQLAREMGKYWSTFAVTGVPNPSHGNLVLPTWSEYTRNLDNVLELRTDNQGGIVPVRADRKEACDYWDARFHRKDLRAAAIVV